jgi:hypothetical protein
MVTYAMNHIGLGTWFSSGFIGATKSDGTKLDRETRMADLSASTIVLADSKPGRWHVGNILDLAGQEYDPEIHGSEATNLRFSYNGKSNFIRSDGSAFSSSSFPPPEAWVVDGRSN